MSRLRPTRGVTRCALLLLMLLLMLLLLLLLPPPPPPSLRRHLRPPGPWLRPIIRPSDPPACPRRTQKKGKYDSENTSEKKESKFSSNYRPGIK